MVTYDHSDHDALFLSIPLSYYRVPAAAPLPTPRIAVPSDTNDPLWDRWDTFFSPPFSLQPEFRLPLIADLRRILTDLVDEADAETQQQQQQHTHTLSTFSDLFFSSMYNIAVAAFGLRKPPPSPGSVKRAFRSSRRRKVTRSLKSLGGLLFALRNPRLPRSYHQYTHNRKSLAKDSGLDPPRPHGPFTLAHDQKFVEDSLAWCASARRSLVEELDEIIKHERGVGAVAGIAKFVSWASAHRGHFYQNLTTPTSVHADAIACVRADADLVGDCGGSEICWDGEVVGQMASDWGSNLFRRSRENDPLLAAPFLSAQPKRVDWSEVSLGPFSDDEIKSAIADQDGSKSPGHDSLTGSLFHHLPPDWVSALGLFFSACLHINFVPDSLRKGLIKTIPKQGKARIGDLNSLRCITLLPVGLKIFERLLRSRIFPVVCQGIDCQKGFCRRRKYNSVHPTFGCHPFNNKSYRLAPLLSSRGRTEGV